MKKSYIIFGLIVIAVVIILVVMFLTGNQGGPAASAAPGDTASVNSTSGPSANSPAPAPASALAVNYTDSGFSPDTPTVHKGDTVAWTNNSSGPMWVASGVHPTHTLYSGTTLAEHCPDTAGTAFDACGGVSPGQSWSFTFQKTGTWSYHNHLRAGDNGIIVVQ